MVSSGFINFCTVVNVCSCAVESHLNRRHILAVKKAVDQGKKKKKKIRLVLKYHQTVLSSPWHLADARFVPYHLLQSRLGGVHLINLNKIISSSRKEKASKLIVLLSQLSC